MTDKNISSSASSESTDAAAQQQSAVNPDAQALKVSPLRVPSLAQEDSFFVVGIGASAGGLRALEDFFAHMPQDSGAAFVVIQHLSPDYKSLMKELLGRCTHMNIHRVEEGMTLAPNSIYLIPPGQNLVVSENQLHLTKQKRLKGRHPNFPIDLFFESLAEDCCEHTIAVVLSGTGSDGSRGIQAIHEAGGIVLAQDLATAEFDGMPQSALATGVVDSSLPPGELAQLVYQLVCNPGVRQSFQQADPFISIQKIQLQKILQLLAMHGSIDFSQYKTSTLSRRIQRRCLIAGVQDLDRYLALLETSAPERQTLQDDLLISVTQFFRDGPAWQFLETEILPPLVEAMSAEHPLRIWVTACATGEEAYSMAILVNELATAQGKPVHAKIFATDIAGQCLQQAALGVFSDSIMHDVDERRLQRYFTRQTDTYEIIRSIREMIVFAPNNLLKDAGFSRMHLVSCRNVLIYMEPSLQQRVLRNLHFSLVVNGILFLGESESLGDLENEFIVRDRRLKIYEKSRHVRLTPSLHEKPLPSLVTANVAPLPNLASNASSNAGHDIRLQEAFRLAMTEQQGCCLIVDNQGRMIHAFGATSQILPPPSGPVSNEVIKMVAPSLQLPLSTALNRARKTKDLVHYSALDLHSEANSELDTVKVNLRVLFHQGSRLVKDFFVVLIQPQELTLAAVSDLSSEDLEQATLQHILELESELQQNRESLQATIEELETTNEEQQSINEEMIASNEELQSTNEELQSVNEELYTVNAEYQSKIQELTELNNDIDNLLRSTDIGVIFLDQELRVRKFTPAATQIFALVKTDEGRPLTHLADNLDLSNLPELLCEVLETHHSLEQEVKLSNSEQHLLMRIHPYRLDNQHVDGLVLTFVDITTIHQAQKALEENNLLLETVINSTLDPIFVKDLQGRYQLVNEAAAQLLGQTATDLIGVRDADIFPAAVAQRVTATDQEILVSGEVKTFEESIAITATETRNFLTTKAVFRGSQGYSLGIVGFARNVTRLKQAQERLEDANRELQQEIEQRQAAILALQESEARFRATFEQAAVGIAHVAPNGTLIRINQRFADICGYSKEELLNKTFQSITHPDDLATDLEYVQQVLAGDIPTYTMNKRYLRKDQSLIWVELTVTLVRSTEGEPQYFISVIQDISVQRSLAIERDRVLQELSHEKELAQITLHSIGDAVITTDAEARVQYCNPIAEELTGWSLANAKGRLIQDVVTLLEEETHQPATHPVASVLASPDAGVMAEHLLLVSRTGREFTVSKSAAPIRDPQGELLGVVTVFRDVTEARTLSRQLSWQASHDSLTGLMNRRQFERELIQILNSTCIDDRQEHVLCYLDLDQFKVVNDTCGHLAGDELLRQVAMLLKSRVRGSDYLARLGGDEFGVLLQSCPLSRAVLIANDLREDIHAYRFVWEKRTFSIGASIGLVAINHSLDLHKVLSAADAACYAAKERGRNRVYVYQSDDADVNRQRNEREWSVRIQNALEHNQFCFYQQRVVPTQYPSDENGTHYEVLLRMTDTEGTLILPDTFIPAAERYDLMPQIDRWVVQKFLLHMANQANLDGASASYMVNLSGASLTDETFLAFLQTQLKSNPAIAQRLCFEITETAAISNLTEAVDFITEIQKLGCRFALDDFGSGMSSFGYLKTLPVDYIKIDGKFVQEITTDPTARSIVESINNIGHVMGLQTIAEFVENDATRDYLQEIGVDYLQGYGIAQPQLLQT